MNDIEEKTRGNTGTVLNVAVNYGGRQEIVRGMQIWHAVYSRGCCGLRTSTLRRYRA